MVSIRRKILTTTRSKLSSIIRTRPTEVLVSCVCIHTHINVNIPRNAVPPMIGRGLSEGIPGNVDVDMGMLQTQETNTFVGEDWNTCTFRPEREGSGTIAGLLG